MTGSVTWTGDVCGMETVTVNLRASDGPSIAAQVQIVGCCDSSDACRPQEAIAESKFD